MPNILQRGRLVFCHQRDSGHICIVRSLRRGGYATSRRDIQIVRVGQRRDMWRGMLGDSVGGYPGGLKIMKAVGANGRMPSGIEGEVKRLSSVSGLLRLEQ